jgi:hypothetical protein
MQDSVGRACPPFPVTVHQPLRASLFFSRGPAALVLIGVWPFATNFHRRTARTLSFVNQPTLIGREIAGGTTLSDGLAIYHEVSA